MVKEMSQKEHFPIISEDKVKHLRAQFSKKNVCSCGHQGLHDLPIQGYPNHPGGWEIPELAKTIGSGVYNLYWWLFVICPDCDFAVSLSKLGVERERY